MSTPVLTEANDEEKAARDVLCHAEWGARLTVPQFVSREARLRAHLWARREMRTWLWRESQAAGARVLASCETFRMDSFSRGLEGNTYGVASVFTEPSLRGRGYAGAMMRALVSRLREEDPRAQTSILFSDVGAPLYERAGYEAVSEPWDRVIETRAAAALSPGVRLFSETELEPEWRSVQRPEEAAFLVWPSAAQLDWHLERERIYAGILGGRRPAAIGAALHDSRIFWAADFKNGRLMVLHLSAHDESDRATLLDAACSVAHEAGLARVVRWEDPAPPRLDGEGGRMTRMTRVRRSGELPMLAPLNANVTAAAWTHLPRGLWV